MSDEYDYGRDEDMFPRGANNVFSLFAPRTYIDDSQLTHATGARLRYNRSRGRPTHVPDKASMNPDQLFVNGGVGSYINLCHNAGCGSVSYGSVIEPRRADEDCSESPLLPGFSASLLNSFFSYSYKLDKFHKTWDSEADPSAHDRACLSLLASKIMQHPKFKDLRDNTKGESMRCLASVARAITKLRAAKMLPLVPNPGEEWAPDEAQRAYNSFEEELDRAGAKGDLNKVIDEAISVSEDMQEFEQSMDQTFSMQFGKGQDESASRKPPTTSDVDFLDLFAYSRVWLTSFLKDVGKYMGIIGAIRKKQKSLVGPPLPALGGDFMSADPAEIALLKTPARPTVLYRASIDLLSVTEPHIAEQDLGPFMIAIDVSSSMGNDPTYTCASRSVEYQSGNRFNFARAIGASIAMIALQQKRPVKMIAFNSSIQGEVDLSLVEPAGAPKSVLAFVSSLVCDGGTNFNNVLTVARNFKQQHQGRADLVFVTDGECGLRPWKKEDPRIFTVLVGEASADACALVERSESFAQIPDTTNPQHVNRGLITFSKSLDDEV